MKTLKPRSFIARNYKGVIIEYIKNHRSENRKIWQKGECLRCLCYHVHSHSVNRTGTKWHGVVLIFYVACSSPDDGSALQCDKWSHLKTQVPAKSLAKRGETDTLKIGNNWVNITQTSNCNLLHEQYSFQRSKHFLNICAICSPSRANYKV